MQSDVMEVWLHPALCALFCSKIAVYRPQQYALHAICEVPTLSHPLSAWQHLKFRHEDQDRKNS